MVNFCQWNCEELVPASSERLWTGVECKVPKICRISARCKVLSVASRTGLAELYLPFIFYFDESIAY